MNKRFIGIVLLLILMGLGVAQMVFSSRPPQSDFARSISQKTGTATPIQKGVMTEKQKQHSRLFKGFDYVTWGKKLGDLAAEQGDVSIKKSVGNVRRPVSFSLGDYLRTLTCKSDAIVIGTVKSKSSQLTDDETFVFTDYEISVSDILKNNRGAVIEPGSSITFTGSGGAVILNGHTIRALDERNEPLENGEKYLLYLEFVPSTGAYKAFDNSRDSEIFQIKDDGIIQASRKPLPFGIKRTTKAGTFLAEVHAALIQECSK